MPNNIAGIILAAGKSTRFGAPKVLQSFLGIPFVTHIVNALHRLNINDIRLVLGYQSESLTQRLPEKDALDIVENPLYELGQFSSLRSGIEGLDSHVIGAVMCLVDCPHISLETYQTVVATAQDLPDSIVIPTYEDRGGHPVYIPAGLFDEIIEANPAVTTLRDIFQRYSTLLHRIPVNEPGIRWDIDTPEDLRRIEALYGGKYE